MRALTFDGTTLQYDPAYPTPELPPGHVRVRVRKAGVCNTDLELVKGYMGFSGVLGHEFVGVVETAGPLAGRRVAGEINLACGTCDTCLGGTPTQCPQRTTLGIDRHDGAFADYLTLPVENIHPLPDAISDDQAVFVEPLAAALQTLHLTHVSPQQRVILLGAGKLGLLNAQVLALTGCDLSVVARHPRQLELCAGWGIDARPAADLTARTADIVVDCTGSPSGFADALNLVRPRGVIHLKSTYADLLQADLTRAVVDEVQIHTSRCGPFPAAIRLLARGLIDVDALVDARYPLDEGLAAIQQAQQKGTLKVLLDVAN